MDNMEDSGFDSDPKGHPNGGVPQNDDKDDGGSTTEVHDATTTSSGATKTFRKSSNLQKKLERQREALRKSQAVVDQQPKKGILTRNRLKVPSKDLSLHVGDTQPLVMIETDESEDEFTVPTLSKEAHKEITQQLIKDGYNLDLEPDDEDLDLIPPRPLNERCVCCPTLHLKTNFNATTCCIQ